MNVDKAVRCLYILVGECRHSLNYTDALRALQVVEDATEALHRSQQVMELQLKGDFDKRLHGVMLCNAIAENKKLLTP